MEMDKEILPIGTVVELKGIDKPIMIFGYYQIDVETNKKYDYIGIVYPIGKIDKSNEVVFNKEFINDVLFTGYKTKQFYKLTEKFINIGE